MKRLHATSTVCMLLTLLTIGSVSVLNAQTQNTQEEKNKKVLIIQKSTQENAEENVRVIELRGDVRVDVQPEVQFQTDDAIIIHDDLTNLDEAMQVNSNVNVDWDKSDAGTKIHININGEEEVIELAPGEELSEADQERLAAKGVYVDRIDDHNSLVADRLVWRVRDDNMHLGSISEGLVQMGKELTHASEEFIRNGAFAWSGETGHINCVALGIYASTNREGGVYVSNIIGASGAEEAGIGRGDVVTAIDEYPTPNYPALHEALAMYRPGDVVAVTFEREGVEQRVEAQLRAWRDLPAFANRPHAMVSCDSPKEEVVSRKIIVIKKDREDEARDEDPSGIATLPTQNRLDLQDFTAFPNPSDGRFNVRFTAEAVPTVVSVFDAAGKEIFRDNLEEFSGSYDREMNFTDYARGGFVLSVEQGGKVFTEQIILN